VLEYCLPGNKKAAALNGRRFWLDGSSGTSEANWAGAEAADSGVSGRGGGDSGRGVILHEVVLVGGLAGSDACDGNNNKEQDGHRLWNFPVHNDPLSDPTQPRFPACEWTKLFAERRMPYSYIELIKYQ